MAEAPRMLVLSAAGCALILDAEGPGLPRVVHWGAGPGPLIGLSEAVAPSVESRVSHTVLPAQAQGWHGRPGVLGHRDGAWPHLRLEAGEGSQSGDTAGIEARDPAAGIAVTVHIVMEPSGVVRMATRLHNEGAGVYTVDAISCQL